MPPRSTSWRFILMLSSQLSLNLPNGPFPSRFPTKTLYGPLLFPIRATRPIYLILIDLTTRLIFGMEYRSLRSSSCSFLLSRLTSSLLGTNILLSTLFSHTLSLYCSLNVSDQVSHPYNTTGRIIVPYIFIFKFFRWQTGRQKILHRMIASISWLQSVLNFVLNIIRNLGAYVTTQAGAVISQWV